MIRLTNLADYAVVVMTAAAKSPERRLSAPEVALVTGIPVPTVAKLMGTLARAGLLSASRGAAGGFQFCGAAADVSIAAIIEAVDGPIALTQCQQPLGQQQSGQNPGAGAVTSDCSIGSSCSVRGHWAPINRAVRDALCAVTLAELIQPAVAPRESVPA
ncbi:MAG: SUF system Fe-S cluster assembly regulator [Polymorphobacter sp.]